MPAFSFGSRGHGLLCCYDRGEIIYHSEEPTDGLYVLRRGAMRVRASYSAGRRARAKEATLRLLGPWDYFGRITFYGTPGQGPRISSYAEAISACEMQKVPRVVVEQVLHRDPRVAPNLITLMDLRLSDREELARCLFPLTIEVRLLKLFPILARKFGVPLGPKEKGPVEIALRLTHQDLAEMIASTRESVNLALGRLRRSGVIELRGGHILLLPEYRETRALTRAGKYSQIARHASRGSLDSLPKEQAINRRREVGPRP